MNCLCYVPEDAGPTYDRVGMADWPPLHPPSFIKQDGYKLISGYLKRKSSKTEAKWAVRWMEVEPPDATRPDVMLAVYKTDLKEKRLNAVSLRNITDVTLHDENFDVTVGTQVYTLQARDKNDALKWTTVLTEDVMIARDEREPEDNDACVLS